MPGWGGRPHLVLRTGVDSCLDTGQQCPLHTFCPLSDLRIQQPIQGELYIPLPSLCLEPLSPNPILFSSHPSLFYNVNCHFISISLFIYPSLRINSFGESLKYVLTAKRYLCERYDTELHVYLNTFSAFLEPFFPSNRNIQVWESQALPKYYP